MKVIVKNARLSFNDLFKAKSIRGSDPKFTATLICSDHTKLKYTTESGSVVGSHTDLEEICNEVLKKNFGGKIPPKHNNYVYNKADGSTTRDEYVNEDGDFWDGFDAETWYISAGKKEANCKDGKMVVLDQSKKPIAQNSGAIFSGCYVNAIIDVYAYSEPDKGVTASLEAIQLLKTGEPLGFSPIDAVSEFDEEEIEVDEML